ncbi:unnamed protein product [Cylindrotheca closterium]|uniref:Uncharacterized protein n=1 Tax=Cylindrotheca closterium TaxID=2856 RepID=A0AAD2G1B3_9STRA|nr:unnamed protein product [Cylindrotheca closterium]
MNLDNSQLTQYLIAAFDTETMEVNPSEEIWFLRILAMRISLQNPFSFFGIDEFEGKPDDNHCRCWLAKDGLIGTPKYVCKEELLLSHHPGELPNHDSKAVLDAFDPTKDLQLQDLNSLVEKGVQGGAPAWYTGWPKEQVNNFNFWNCPMIRYMTVGEKKEQHFDKLYVLDHDVLENGSDPLAFSWPAKAFSKTNPVKVPKLEAWLINEALEQYHSKLFVMEDITDEDPVTAYDLLVTRKRMPIPKEFLDIAWDGSLAREVLRLVIDRIKILANSDEKCMKNFARLDLEDSIGDSPDKTYELLTKTLAAVEESNKTTKTSVESLLEVVVAGIHGQASDKVPPNTVEKKWPTRLSYLKRVAGTTTSAQLPTLWHELAKSRVIKSLVELEFCSRGDVEKGLNVFNSVCFQHYKNANAINDYNKSDYWLTGEKTTASMKDHQAHDKIKHAIFPRDPMQFREMVNSMRVFYLVVFGKTHPLTAVYEKFAKNVDLIARKMGVSQQERALERFLFGIYSRIDHRYFEHLVRSGTNAEENLPDLGTYMETCYHGGSLPESSLFVVAKDPVGPGGTGDKTESQLKREKERAQGHPEKICRFQPKHPLPQEDMYFPWRSACRREQA